MKLDCDGVFNWLRRSTSRFFKIKYPTEARDLILFYPSLMNNLLIQTPYRADSILDTRK